MLIKCRRIAEEMHDSTMEFGIVFIQKLSISSSHSSGNSVDPAVVACLIENRNSMIIQSQKVLKRVFLRLMTSQCEEFHQKVFFIGLTTLKKLYSWSFTSVHLKFIKWFCSSLFHMGHLHIHFKMVFCSKYQAFKCRFYQHFSNNFQLRKLGENHSKWKCLRWKWKTRRNWQKLPLKKPCMHMRIQTQSNIVKSKAICQTWMSNDSCMFCTKL